MGSVPEEDNMESHRNSRFEALVDRMNRSARCRCCLWMVALWCAATVVFMLAGYDSVVHKVTLDRMILRPGGQKFESWRQTKMPVYYKVHVFNLTNPIQFMTGSRPILTEKGPYVYLVKESKERVRFHANGSVTFRPRTMYFYQPHLSHGSEEDVITTVNIPFVNAADAVKDGGIQRVIIQMAKKIHGFQTLRRVTVGELLWGYKSRVMEWAKALRDIPYPYPLFGIMVGMNDTSTEDYTMHTGKGDLSKVNQIISWNGRHKLNLWKSKQCNKIKGTDASGFAPGLSKDDKLDIFVGKLCRSMPLVYNQTIVHSGIETYRFVPPEDVFEYGMNHSNNNCYCPGHICPTKGILDMRNCYLGAAVAFSFPHFYSGNPKLTHVVLGLRYVQRIFVP